jgi:hypothetical protein
MKIDLNNIGGKDHALGDPHWLSGSGKVDRKGIHERTKAAYLAKRGPLPRTLARPETTARLEAVSAHAKKTERGMKKPPPG